MKPIWRMQNLGEILSYVIAQFGVVAKAKKNSISFSNPGTPLMIHCDAKQINALFFYFA